LLGAWAAARSSPRLTAWLEGHPTYGAHIRDWRVGGVVRRKAKWAATIMMAASALIILISAVKPWAQVMSIGTMIVVGAWLWRRPEGLGP
jgi:uncharacterized membrane protein YbaN (DUF454 family)